MAATPQFTKCLCCEALFRPRRGPRRRCVHCAGKLSDLSQAASVAVRKALKEGRLTRQPCEVCGNPRLMATTTTIQRRSPSGGSAAAIIASTTTGFTAKPPNHIACSLQPMGTKCPPPTKPPKARAS